MSDTVLVVLVNPYDKLTGLLVPVVAQRILDFAQQHFNELNPESYTRVVMSRLWANDPRIAVAALVEAGTCKVVGHGVATIEEDGANKWVFVSQCKADGNVGDAIQRAIKMAEEWGAAQGATKMVMSTPRSDAAWKRKYGFDTMRHLMIRQIGSPITKEAE